RSMPDGVARFAELVQRDEVDELPGVAHAVDLPDGLRLEYAHGAVDLLLQLARNTRGAEAVQRQVRSEVAGALANSFAARGTPSGQELAHGLLTPVRLDRSQEPEPKLVKRRVRLDGRIAALNAEAAAVDGQPPGLPEPPTLVRG